MYANESDLPSSGIQPGDHAFVSATNDLYIRTASQWRNIDAINLSPSVSMSLSSHSFSAEGETIDVTYTTNEPEGTPIVVTVANSGLSTTDEATITHHAGNNTITILAGNTPFTNGLITLSATDGVNIGTGTVGIALQIGLSFSGVTQLTEVIRPSSGGDVPDQNDHFGSAVTMSGDGNFIAVGASGDAGNGNSFYNNGEVWIYKANAGQTAWSISGFQTGGIQPPFAACLLYTSDAADE